MNSHKSNSNLNIRNHERKQPVPAVVVRTTVMHNAGERLIIARDAEMRLQQGAPKQSEILFESGYAKWLTSQAVTNANDAAPITKNKKTEHREAEHLVAATIDEHEVTDKPQGRLDLDDESQETIDHLAIDAMAADTTPELSEQPDSQDNVDYSLEERRAAKAKSIEEARENVVNAKPRERKELDGDIQKPAA